jgi:hypothetical protein
MHPTGYSGLRPLHRQVMRDVEAVELAKFLKIRRHNSLIALTRKSA